jgi:hypothetical protein
VLSCLDSVQLHFNFTLIPTASVNMKVFILSTIALFCSLQAVVHGRSISGLASRIPSSNNTCTDPQPNTCTFYSGCLEAQLQCGSEGYPIGYGVHYCQLFTNARSQMSESGQTWITNTMLCLQRDLVPYGTGEQSTTCDDLREYAFGTHPHCYVDSGVCTLPPEDWLVIVNTVSLPELFDSWDALKATLETAGDCTEFYAWLIGKGIVRAWEEAGEAIENAGEAVVEAGEAAWDWTTSWF